MLIRTHASILFKTEDIIFFPLIRKIKNKDIECTKRLKKKKWTEMRHSIVHVNWIAHVHYSHLVETKGKCFSYCPFFFFFFVITFTYRVSYCYTLFALQSWVRCLFVEASFNFAFEMLISDQPTRKQYGCSYYK